MTGPHTLGDLLAAVSADLSPVDVAGEHDVELCRPAGLADPICRICWEVVSYDEGADCVWFHVPWWVVTPAPAGATLAELRAYVAARPGTVGRA